MFPNHPAFLPAPQTIYKFSLKPALLSHSCNLGKSPDVVVSQWKGKTFAAPRLPKRSFYHKAHLIKLTPLQVALQTRSFKQTPYTNQRNRAPSHTLRHTRPQLCSLMTKVFASFPLPLFLVFTGSFCPMHSWSLLNNARRRLQWCLHSIHTQIQTHTLKGCIFCQEPATFEGLLQFIHCRGIHRFYAMLYQYRKDDGEKERNFMWKDYKGWISVKKEGEQQWKPSETCLKQFCTQFNAGQSVLMPHIDS